MFGGLGNGLTVYDKSRRTGNLRLADNDYLEVAHITTSGMIKYYADVNDEERAAICKRALLMQDEWLNTYGQDYGSTADAQRRLKEAQENAYNSGYEYPDNVAVNSSRLSAKTQRAIRHCINSARRRAGLNCSTRYSTKYRVKPNGDSFTLYFISDDGLNNAMFEVNPDFQGACNVEGEILGADTNWEIDSYENWFNSSESRDIYELLRYDAEGSTGVDMHECSEADYNASCAAIEQAKKQLNSARRRAALQTNRRLNCGYYYDGEDYSEMGYDKEQDAYYDLPDEMWIYRLNLSQFDSLVRDGYTDDREVHGWIDRLSENWGGIPAWSSAKPLSRYEIQDLTEDEYYTWKDNFPAELARFADAVTRR